MPKMIKMVGQFRPLEVDTEFPLLTDADPDKLYEWKMSAEDGLLDIRIIWQLTGTFATVNFVTLNRGDLLYDLTDTTPAVHMKETNTDDDNFSSFDLTT